MAGTMRPGCTSSASLVRRSSGTLICPICASMVQNGKFAACAFALDRQLKRVDLPTFGSPTIPAFNAMVVVGLWFGCLRERPEERWQRCLQCSL